MTFNFGKCAAILRGSRNMDRHFVAEMEEDGRARLRFGDNEHGMRPEISTEFRAEYREGNGPQGNIVLLNPSVMWWMDRPAFALC